MTTAHSLDCLQTHHIRLLSRAQVPSENDHLPWTCHRDFGSKIEGFIWIPQLLSQSSQLAELLWTDPGLKSGISVRELISARKKEEKHRRGMNGQTFSKNPRKRGKSHHSCLVPTTIIIFSSFHFYFQSLLCFNVALFRGGKNAELFDIISNLSCFSLQ